MKYLLSCYFLVMSSVITFSQTPNTTTTSYSIPGSVPELKQKSEMACWITVTTMMVSWKEGKKYTVDQIAARLGDPWKFYYEVDSGLPPEEQANFVKKIQLRAEPPANYIISAYLEFLQKYGPLWITTGDEFGAHARLLIGIEGDGSYENSSFILIDPKPGKIKKQNALAFMREFEEEARVANRQEAEKKGSWPQLRIQIYHF